MTAQNTVWRSVAIASPDDPANTLKPNLDSAVAVTASDSTVYDPPLLSLWVGSTGDVAVRMSGSQNAVTFASVGSGVLLKMSVDKVLSTGTTASDIIGLY